MKKVLIVEDEELLQKVYFTTLSEAGYEVLTAIDIQTALKIFNESKPDLILLDIKLPDGSGFTLVERIRKIDKKVPIIVATAYDRTKKEKEVWADQVTDYIVKPIKLSELREKINKILAV